MKKFLIHILILCLLAGCKQEEEKPKAPKAKTVKKSTKPSSPKKSKKSSSSDASEPIAKSSYSSMEEEILYYVNRYRQSKGLPMLQMNGVIVNEAEKHSKNMATGRTPFGHMGFYERVDHITDRLGRLSASAENVAYGYLSAKEVVNGWLHSPGHKRNIEGKYKLTGIGVAKERTGRLFFTQIFTIK